METIIKVLLLSFVALLLTYNIGSKQSMATDDGANNATSSLVRAYSLDSVEASVKASLLKEFGTYDHNAGDGFTLASSDSQVTAMPNRDYSTTMLQESNVNEADRLKTDGDFIYVSSIDKRTIKVFNTSLNQNAAVNDLTITSLPHNSILSGLYLRPSQDQLIATANDGKFDDSNAHDSWFYRDYWLNRKTVILDIDIQQRAAPSVERQLSLDGQLISSRRIGNILYVITRQSVDVPGLVAYPSSYVDAAQNRLAIRKLTMESILPKYRIDNREHDIFDSSDCLYANKQPSTHMQHSIISLLAIDLDAENLTPTGQCFIGDSEALYASTHAIYLATTQYVYPDEYGDLSYSEQITTEIHKFSLKDNQPNYVGSGSIKGHLGWQQSLKSFRMSEKDGLLRVLSYVGETADSHDSPARLHILAESPESSSLQIISTLPNASRPDPLGKKGEHIYASRFIGDKGYLVTFRATDPLYIMDLADPKDPKILSALEIDGYSDLLLPVGDKFLLGIGKDAIPATIDGQQIINAAAWDQGVKLSLIDISDPSAPFEKEKIIIGKRGSETATSATHHALSSVVRNNSLEINIPISLHDTVVENFGPENHPSDYFGWTEDQLFRLKIDLDSGDVTTLSPIAAELTETPEDTTYYIDTNWAQDRSAIVGKNTYYLKRDQLFTASD